MNNITITLIVSYSNAEKSKSLVLKVADLRLGSKPAPETLLKYKNRKLSSEALANKRLAKGHITTVVNIENNSVKLYDSIRGAARDLTTSHTSLLNYINRKKLYKGKY